jgi:hypothetical protein
MAGLNSWVISIPMISISGRRFKKQLRRGIGSMSMMTPCPLPHLGAMKNQLKLPLSTLLRLGRNMESRLEKAFFSSFSRHEVKCLSIGRIEDD